MPHNAMVYVTVVINMVEKLLCVRNDVVMLMLIPSPYIFRVGSRETTQPSLQGNLKIL